MLNQDRIILNQEDREMIKKYYEDDNIKLSKLINIDLKDLIINLNFLNFFLKNWFYLNIYNFIKILKKSKCI